jgi:hypothetical protein
MILRHTKERQPTCKLFHLSVSSSALAYSLENFFNTCPVAIFCASPEQCRSAPNSFVSTR